MTLGSIAMSVASGSTCWRRYASVSRTRSSSNGIGLSTIFGSLASFFASFLAPFFASFLAPFFTSFFASLLAPLGARAGSAIALVLASACAHSTAAPSAAPPSARLWIGGDVFLGAGGHDALAELRNAGIAVAGIANNHARDAGPDGAVATPRALAAAGVLPAGGLAGPA